jgi:hypothetical protein
MGHSRYQHQPTGIPGGYRKQHHSYEPFVLARDGRIVTVEG